MTISELLAQQGDKNAELARLRAACQKNDNDIEQILGRALGYPRYCDDQINFPGSTDADGVCVGDQVAASLAMQASDLVAQLRAALAEAERERDEALLNLSKQTEYAEILAEKSHNMEVQRDEARALSGGWRRSATYYKGGFMTMGSAWYEDTLKRAEEAERGQAGKE